MNTFLEILVCFLAGAGAGIGTGFAGMSAAAVIGPVLITFLDIPAYQAVGIGLASDVLASAISAWTYKKNGNLDIKNSLPLLATVLVTTVIGSLIAKLVPETAMGYTMQIAMIVLGIKFIVKPVSNSKESAFEGEPKKRLVKSIIGGTLIGFICGFVGAGGGMMMLFVLTVFLGYEMHMAVGTSVFIMAFTALTGGVSHFIIGGVPDLLCLSVCVASTLVWSLISAKIANKADAKTLNRVVGAVLISTSVAILLVNYVF